MQAYEGYIENGRFSPIGITANITGRRRVIVTVFDEPAESQTAKELPRKEYLALLDELCGSVDDPTFVPPSEIPWEHNAPREEII